MSGVWFSAALPPLTADDTYFDLEIAGNIMSLDHFWARKCMLYPSHPEFPHLAVAVEE
jgi:hypothetical protein